MISIPDSGVRGGEGWPTSAGLANTSQPQESIYILIIPATAPPMKAMSQQL